MRMHNNPVFLTFLAFLGLIVIGYGAVALYKYYRYTILTASAPAVIEKWSIEADLRQWPMNLLFEDAYRVQADYSFVTDQIKYEGKTIFREKYRNTWAAEQSQKKMEQENWIVWYQPGNAHYSTLQKNFPLKECVSAGVLAALLLYFIWLGSYVTKYRM